MNVSRFLYPAAAWAIAAFFVVGGMVNAVPGEETAASYVKWGYPNGFHYLTAALEFSTAVLIAYPLTRFYGALLGSGVMAAALLTLILHAEFSHALLPLVVLILTLALAAYSRRRRSNARRFGADY